MEWVFSELLLENQKSPCEPLVAWFVRCKGQLPSYRLKTVLPLLLTLWLAGCTSLPTATPAVPDLQLLIGRAVAYLQNEYDPAIGLIRESPVTAPDRYWLTTDNWLAALALRPYDKELADTLPRTIQRYGGAQHGLIEALAGEAIAWPPYVARQYQVSQQGVWVERRDRGDRHEDWAAYSDLALYAALNAYNQGRTDEARRLYKQALAKFDGIGFADQVWQADGLYATYKLALALYIGGKIGERPALKILLALLSKQHASGGFTTLYDRTGEPKGDPNTETTAYSLLALQQLTGTP